MNNWEILHVLSTRTGISLVHFLWQGTVVGMLMFALLSVLRNRSPRLRYGLACAGLLVMLVLPVINFASSSPLQLGDLEAGESLSESIQLTPSHTNLASPNEVVDTPVAAGDRASAIPATTAVSVSAQVPTRPGPAMPGIGYRIAPWLTALWGLGVVLLGLRDVMGLLAVRRLRRTAQPVEAALHSMAAKVQRQLGMDRTVSVGWSSYTDSAVALGWLTPMVLLPMTLATGVPPAALQAILAHEFAHIQRHDAWVNLFQRMVENLLFFHPVVWWLSNEIRKEREMCCDDIAVAQCEDRVEYIHGILAMVEAAHPATGLAMSARGGDLAHRVARMLQTANPADASIRPLAGFGAMSLVLVPLTMCFFMVASHAADEAMSSTLQFPVSQSVGTVSVRWADSDYRQQPWLPDHNEGWTVLSDARGDVLIPEDCHVRLQTKATDLSFLEAMAPDALFALDCQAAGLRDEQLAPIAHLTGLRALDLSLNRELTDVGMNLLGGLTKLEWLGIEKTAISGKATSVFQGFSELLYFDGFSSQFSNEGLLQLSSLEKLQWLGLENSKGIPESGPLHIGKMKSLLGINLEKGNVNDTVLLELGDMPNLQYLSLRNNNITDQGLQNLGAFPALKTLSLSMTKVTDTWLCELNAMPNLQNLNLEQTGVTFVCKEALFDIPSLSSVVLSKTAVVESLQREINGVLANRAVASSPAQRSSNPDAPKVGLYLSHFTATGPSWTGHPAGYHHQHSREIARFLSEANFDVYAVIEPDTEFLGELPALLLELGLGEKTIEGSNATELGKLDVFFGASMRNVPTPVLLALERAVRGGMGFVNIDALASVTPGDEDPTVEALTGLTNIDYAWRGFDAFACEVIEGHPILGQLKPGTEMSIPAISGYYGPEVSIAQGTVLLGNAQGFPSTFHPMYVRDHGQGRIVRCQWFRMINTELPFGQYGLYVRAVNWAAKRDVDAVW